MWPSSARATLALRPPWPARRMGLRTACFTINLDAVGNMPCNPAIGGTGKGHLVRELDALGGEMGRAADRACIQYRLLNRGKGPAVWSLRAQADRREYQEDDEAHPGAPGEPVGEAGRGGGDPYRRRGGVAAWSLTARGGLPGQGGCGGHRDLSRRHAPSWGRWSGDSGPDGLAAAVPLTAVPDGRWACAIRRFKTGTPPRVNARSVDFSQHGACSLGMRSGLPFSFPDRAPAGEPGGLLADLHQRSAPTTSSGTIWTAPPCSTAPSRASGPGTAPPSRPRWSASPDKERHQLFVEPMGLDTEELYIQGFSSSLPEEVQLEMLHTIPGLEQAEMTAPAPTPSNMTASTPPSCCPRWRASRCPDSTARDSSTAPPAMRRRRCRALWRA